VLGLTQRGYINRINEMTKKAPAKGEANKLHGLTPNDADPQTSREQAEAGDEFDAILRQLSAVIGIDDVVFCTGLLKQNLWFFSDRNGKFDGARFGFAIAVLQADKPRNHTDAIDKMQDLATDVLTMEFAKRLWFAETLQEIDNAERTYNKLARTRLARRQAREPDRSGSIPNLTVVSVSDGSQAIVGPVTQPTPEPRSDNPTQQAAEKGVPPTASRPDTQGALMPPAGEGTAQSQTGVRPRKPALWCDNAGRHLVWIASSSR
jgi:hypothetical protein